MEKDTHLYLADKIYDQISAGFPLNISREVFRKANIMPDFSRKAIRHPHFAEYSIGYIASEIDRLSEERLFTGESPSESYVETLGRITHYLCDYFCQAHVGSHLLSLRRHIAYEHRLKRAVQSQPQHFERVFQTVSVQAFQPGMSLEQYYRHYMHLYNKQPHGFERDIRFASQISSNIAEGIVGFCMNRSEMVS